MKTTMRIVGDPRIIIRLTEIMSRALMTMRFVDATKVETHYVCFDARDRPVEARFEIDSPEIDSAAGFEIDSAEVDEIDSALTAEGSDNPKSRAFVAFRQRLLGRRMLYINTADRHHDHAVAERMRERANVIELVLSDLDTAEREP